MYCSCQEKLVKPDFVLQSAKHNSRMPRNSVFHLLHPICCVCVQVCAWHGRDSSLLVFFSLCHVCCFRSPATPAHDRLYDGKFIHDILLFVLIYFSPSLPPSLLPTIPLLSSLSFSQTFFLPLFFVSSLSSPLPLPL